MEQFKTTNNRKMERSIKIIVASVIVFLVIYNVNSCVNKEINQINGKNSILTDNVNNLKNSIIKKQQEFDKNKKDYESKIEKLQAKIIESSKKVSILEEANKNNKKRIKSLSNIEAAKEFNEVLQVTTAIPTDNGVELTDSLPNTVLEIIADANTCQDINNEKDLQLSIADTVIKNLNNRLGYMVKNTESILQSQEELNKANDELVKSLKNENKKLKTKSGFDKWVVKPLLFASGFYLGYKTAN